MLPTRNPREANQDAHVPTSVYWSSSTMLPWLVLSLTETACHPNVIMRGGYTTITFKHHKKYKIESILTFGRYATILKCISKPHVPGFCGRRNRNKAIVDLSRPGSLAKGPLQTLLFFLRRLTNIFLEGLSRRIKDFGNVRVGCGAFLQNMILLSETCIKPP